MFNTLLQVLDDGRLTDSKARTVDFKNTVIILTSNVGSHRIMEAKGDREKASAAALEELQKQFRPEFLNRIDDKIVFDPLTRGDMDHILEIQLKKVRRLLGEREIKLEVTPAARKVVADLGFDPAYGARPLKRAITQYLLNPMSNAIVGGGYLPNDTVKVDVESGDNGEENLTFERILGPDSLAAQQAGAKNAPPQLTSAK
jgi:ATP-dependent Clp protease ATP-binding subunit ClpB